MGGINTQYKTPEAVLVIPDLVGNRKRRSSVVSHHFHHCYTEQYKKCEHNQLKLIITLIIIYSYRFVQFFFIF